MVYPGPLNVGSSSDGQKFETRISTINARHAPKYFGLKKGVVAYSMVANHVPVNAQIIGTNEHESHYVFDILFNNTTDIQSEVYSTDTHGTNEVNFALLHVFGYQFAPRYRDIETKVREALYGFKHPTQYGNVLLKPLQIVVKFSLHIDRQAFGIRVGVERGEKGLEMSCDHLIEHRAARIGWFEGCPPSSDTS